MNDAITLMGCRIDNLSMEETLVRIEEFIRAGKPHQHVVVNVDKLVKEKYFEQLFGPGIKAEQDRKSKIAYR